MKTPNSHSDLSVGPAQARVTFHGVPPQVPRPLNLRENILIGENLVLPHPADYFPISSPWPQKILALLPQIRKLSDRDLRVEFLTRARSIFDIPSAFQAFKLEEQQAWVDSASQPELGSKLVRPSGSLDARLAHHLHQPSFTTSKPPCGEVADRANPCVHMVMDNAWRERDTLMFDHLHRRSKKSDGFQTFPSNLKNTHEAFTHRIQESSAAKVEIAYGYHVRARMLQNLKLISIPLWGPFQDVVLYLLHEDSFQNPNQDYEFRKFVLFAHHPQTMIYATAGGDRAVQQDHILEVAVRIADSTIHFNPEYFQTRAWQKTMGQSLKTRLYGDESLRKAAHPSQALPVIHGTTVNNLVPGGILVSAPQMEYPQHTREDDGYQHQQRSRVIWQSLLRDEAEASMYPTKVLIWCYACKENTRLSGGEALYLDTNARWTIGLTSALYVCPRATCKRCGNRYFVPKDAAINSISAENLRKFWVKNQHLEPSMQATLLDSYNLQRRGPRNVVLDGRDEELEDASDEPDNVEKIWEPYKRSRSGSRGSDSMIKDSINPKTRHLPTDSSLSWKNKGNSSASKNKGADPIERLKRDPATCNDLPSEVEAWCPMCKEDTIVAPSSNYYSHGRWALDRNPQWTKGQPAAWLGIRLNCGKCGRKKCTFHARDASIPTRNIQGLRAWASKHQELSDGEIIPLLEKSNAKLFSSTFWPRPRKGTT